VPRQPLRAQSGFLSGEIARAQPDRRISVAQPPRPAHIAFALSVGTLNGKTLMPNYPGLPTILVKGALGETSKRSMSDSTQKARRSAAPRSRGQAHPFHPPSPPMPPAAILAKTLPPVSEADDERTEATAPDLNHVDVAIAQIKLGQILAERRRYAEALEPLLEGHRILAAQANPSMSWVASVKAEIASVYEALGDSARAAEFRR
jgi:hypothetical protein